MEVWSDIFQVRGDLIGCTLVDFCEILRWRLFRIQASRRSAKAHENFGSISSSLSTVFLFYLSICWDPFVSPGCTIRLLFFCRFSALFQHVDLVTTTLIAGFPVYLSLR